MIPSTGPAPDRAFFGAGPVTVGIPRRHGMADRERLLIGTEDARSGAGIRRLVLSSGLDTYAWQIDPDADTPPPGNAVVICGPKTAPIGSILIAQDPALDMFEANGRWWLFRRDTRERYGSPSDNRPPASTDLAYIARHRKDDRVIIHIAGIHAIGSLGAVHYLITHAADLLNTVGDSSFSLLIRADYKGLDITASTLVVGPFRW